MLTAWLNGTESRGSNNGCIVSPPRPAERSNIAGRKRKIPGESQEDDYDSDEVLVASQPVPGSRPPLFEMSAREMQNKRRRVADHVLIPKLSLQPTPTSLKYERSPTRHVRTKKESVSTPSSQLESSAGATQRPRRRAVRQSYASQILSEDSSEDDLAKPMTRPSGRSRRLRPAREPSSDFQADETGSQSDHIETSDDKMDSSASSCSATPSSSDVDKKRSTKSKFKTSVAAQSKSIQTTKASRARGPGTSKRTAECMTNLISRKGSQSKGLDYSRPPMHDIHEIFHNITSKATELGLEDALNRHKQRPLRLATMCSGTESPILALEMIRDSLQTSEIEFSFHHLFSAEIVPYKQAYIERNFSSEVIFRDITEPIDMSDRCPPMATTAYGAKAKIPTDIDILIAGTSCVDYSNLNKAKKGIDDGGESGSTFAALLAFCEMSRPKAVILENVYTAPYDEMQARLQRVGYIATGVRVDTKDFYLPQTRWRGYMACFDENLVASNAGKALCETFCSLVEQFKRPASSPVASFLRPPQETAVKEQNILDPTRTEVDWPKCRVSHVEYRKANKLGKARPYSHWEEGGTDAQADHGAMDWLSAQPPRVKDFMDIGLLRKAAPANEDMPFDVRFKGRVWDVSQNIYMDTDKAASGICPCITPSGMPYLTDLARPITPEEALILQGLPQEKISFTTESSAELRDLAGNAMSTTVVGCVTLSLLIAGRNLFLTHENATTRYEESMVVAPTTGGERLQTESQVVSDSEAFTLDIHYLLAAAEKAARRCACEGSTRVSKHDIQQCQKCGHTTCLSCGGNPEHHYHVNEMLSKDRSQPSSFMHELSTILPLRLRPPSLQSFEPLIPSVAHRNHTAKRFLLLLERTTTTEIFGMLRPRRSNHCAVIYQSESSSSRLEFALDPKWPEWRLYIEAPADLACDDPLRDMLRYPVARATVVDSVFDLGWQWRKPTTKTLQARIMKGEQHVPTFWSRNRIPGYETHSQPQQLHVEVIGTTKEGCDIEGTYELLPKCGTSFDSLYARTNLKSGQRPLYFFHDPNPAGPVESDGFVFSHNPERLQTGETRFIEASVQPLWKPWEIRRNESTVDISTHEWITEGNALPLRPLQTTLEMSMPRGLSSNILATECSQAVNVLSLTAPTGCDTLRPLATSYNWISEAIKRQFALDVWAPFEQPEALPACYACAPLKPAPRWSLNEDGKSIERSEDPKMAAIYEKAVKNRPTSARVLVQQRHGTAETNVVSLLLNLNTLAHRTRSRLPADAANVEYRWRYAHGSASSEGFIFRPFHLRETTDITPYEGELAMTIDLHPKQSLSFAWMKLQEKGQKCVIEESQTATFPNVDLRVEMRASTQHYIRGGILADHPGYGKTILSLALIQSQRLEQQSSQIHAELKSRQRGPAEGLIPTCATLIVCPSILVTQWEKEAKTKLKRPGEIIAIRLAGQLDKVSLEDFERAEIIIMSSSLLTSDTYIERLGAAAALPGPVSQHGRAFRDWLHFATERLREHIDILRQQDRKALRRHVQSRYEGNMKSDSFRVEVPSRRLRGKDYVPGGKDKSKPCTRPAPRSLHTDTVGLPLFEMFYFNRIIFDEFPMLETQEFAAVTNLQADKKWGLSGTPAYGDFYDVDQMARLLGSRVPVGSTQRGIMKAKNAREYIKDMTAFERFDAGLEVPTDAGYARIHELCQEFLDTFVRRDVITFPDVTCEDHLVPVKLGLIHQVTYTELSMQLNTQEMKIRKTNKSKTTDRELRQLSAVETSATAEEALSKSAAFFSCDEIGVNGGGLEALIDKRQRETDGLIAKLADAIPQALQEEPEIFATWKSSEVDSEGIGDSEVVALLKETCAARSNKKVANPRVRDRGTEDGGKKKSVRQHTSEIETMVQQLLMSKRSFRFVDNVRKVCEATSAKMASGLCSETSCTAASVDVGVSGLCGHIICKTSYGEMTEKGVYQCPATGCAADMRDHHLLWRSKMAPIRPSGEGPYGVKLSAAVEILQKIRHRDEQAILFVQYESQLNEAKLALRDANIPAATINSARAEQDSKEIETFQHKPRGHEKKTVIVLNASSETAAGLNLQNANHVIFLSPLLRDQKYVYDATMAQAIGRVLRHGQTKEKIHVYRILALDTIDVDVLEHRERRTDALTEEGAPEIVPPEAVRELDMQDEVKAERTQLVKGEDGRYSLRPQSWLIRCGAEDDRDSSVVGRGVGRGRQRVLGWEDFSSVLKFSRQYTEDD